MRRRGFTLVEVLVSLVVLEVGLLGLVGLLVLAARTMTSAEVLERGAARAETLLDSLVASAAGGEGSTPWLFGVVHWRRSAAGEIQIVVLQDADTLLQLEALAPRPWQP